MEWRLFKFRYTDENGKQHSKRVSLPDNAVQCVGRDKNGHEIYEGDELIADTPYNGTVVAVLQPCARQLRTKGGDMTLADLCDKFLQKCAIEDWEVKLKEEV